MSTFLGVMLVLICGGAALAGVLMLQQAYTLFRAADRHEGGGWARLAFCERALAMREKVIARQRGMIEIREREILRMAVKLKRQPKIVINMVCPKRAERVLRVPVARRN